MGKGVRSLRRGFSTRLLSCVVKGVEGMSKHKIQKGLSDADMFKGLAEEESFAESMYKKEEEARTAPKTFVAGKVSKGQSKDELYREFLTEKVESQIGKALLEIKLQYFKDGYTDFSVQVRKNGNNILIETSPKMEKGVQ